MDRENRSPIKPVADGARYTWPFYVRHYELGLSKTARPEVYLNWLQEAGMLASANAGYPLERYEAIGAFWWAHHFRIEWFGAAGYKDLLEATTWISDFRRIRALREYEIRQSEDQSLICCAQADWAFVDTSTGRPTRVTPDLLDSFPPSGVEAMTSLPWEWNFQHNDTRLFATQRIVQQHELDAMGHVNHAIYLVWLLDNLHEYICAADIGANLNIVPERFEIEYLYSAQGGAQLTVTSQLMDWDNLTGRWCHEIRLQNDDTAVICAYSVCRLEFPAGESLRPGLFRLLAEA
jgi:acyl-CoA thioesterase FadM